jgi:TonB-linked SusC/RagA family outer membrane protein
MKRILLFITFCTISLGMFAQAVTIKGKVTLAEDNTSLPGVSVVAAGTSIGTITDFEGNYTINVPSSAMTLRFTFVGMTTEEVAIESRTIIDVAMVLSSEELDEVIVVGYGSKRKGAITGSVATINADVLEQIPVGSFDAALQGQVAGMQVITSSGAPGASATVRIRGVSSLNAGTEPLYIMDGVQITAEDFSAINANDFENISVLKDASATSIYGSKGANGVIIITTKRGKNNQKTEINYRTQFGQSVIASDQFDMMNSSQKIDYEIDLGIRAADNPENDSLRAVNSNWRDALFANAPMQSHELSIRGGNEKTAFYISGGYYDQKGIQYRSSLKRYTARVNLDHKASDKFTVGTRISAGYEQVNNATYATNNIYNLAFRAYLANPYTSLYKADGSFTSPTDGLKWANPIQQLQLNDEMDDQLKVIANVFGEYKILPGLKFKTTVGADFSDNIDYNYLHPESAWGASNSGEVYRGFEREFRLTNTNLLSYEKSFGSHGLSFLAGQESISYKNEDFETEGYSLPNNIVKVLDGTATAGALWQGGISEYSVMSFFGSASYDYDRKYYLDVSYRRDASSRFGAESRWANFWSVGAQWDIKRESFMADLDVFSQFKLRGSIGTTGNYNIGNYNHLQLYSFGGKYFDMNASFPSEPGNPGLTWEKVRMASVALDFQIMNRVSFIIEGYQKVTTDMLFLLPYSYTTGFSDAWDNIGNMSNTGIEVSANFDVVKTSDFRFNINANVAYNDNRVTELYDGKEEIPSDTDSDWFHAVDRPYGSWKMVDFVGVNSANGERIYLDADGNPTNQFLVSNARYVNKSWIAPLQGGLTGTLSYKGFTASAFFSFVQGKYMLNNTRYFMESNGQFGAYGQSTRMLDAWQEPGDVTDIPKPDFANYFDTRLLEDASFLRLKNLTVSYTLPSEWAGATKVFKTLRIYGQAQNLLTWTKYQGFDPEVDEAYELGAYPHVKTITFGIDVGF